MKKNLNSAPAGGDVKELTEEQALGLRDWKISQKIKIVDGYDRLAREQRTNEPVLKYTSKENMVEQLLEMVKADYVNDIAIEAEEWLNERLDELTLNTEQQDPLEIFDQIEEAVEGLIYAMEFNQVN